LFLSYFALPSIPMRVLVLACGSRGVAK